MLIDINAKSSISPDVKLSPRDVARQAKEAGLDGVAFCEHLSTSRCKEALEACRAEGIHGFIGVEIPTDKGILIGFAPEIDEFYLAEEWRQLTELTTPPASEILSLFHRIGGAVIASRPYDLEIPHNMGDLIFTLDGIDGVEVFNGRVGRLQSDFALEAASFMNVPTCGGSDTPKKDQVGSFATFFAKDFASQREFVEALSEAEFWAVQLGETDRKRSSRSKSDSRKGRGGRGRGRGGRRGGGRRRN